MTTKSKSDEDLKNATDSQGICITLSEPLDTPPEHRTENESNLQKPETHGPGTQDPANLVKTEPQVPEPRPTSPWWSLAAKDRLLQWEQAAISVPMQENPITASKTTTGLVHNSKQNPL
jgi:hypothetical protein